MDNAETVQSITAIQANQVVGTQKSDVPEQVTLPTTSMPRQISVLSWINQWQPMGYRVIVALPFVGNDEDFFFAIRNGPFIPTRSLDGYYDASGSPSFHNKEIFAFAYNNMSPVIIPSNDGAAYPSQTNPSISVVNYDLPPPIATISQCFRRWRGDMQYRIRMIAGFATQGYIIATTVKNVFSPIGIYDSFKYRPTIQRQDLSYRASMLNSYALADTSMFRHFELTVPYDYPTPYYDQYAWMARRVTPGHLFESDPTGNPPYKAIRAAIQDEPHGDNWLVFGLRGNLEATVAGAQVIFELEYRCAEGFQFADPFYPPNTMRQTVREMLKEDRVLIFPRDKWSTDGIGDFNPPAVVARAARGVNLGINGSVNIGTPTHSNINEQPKRAPQQPVISVPAQGRRSRRVKRDDPEQEDEGVDVVDPSTLSSLDRLRLAASTLGTSSRNE